MDALAALVDAALAANLGSAAAVSVGDRGREVYRLVRGTTQRVPTVGPAITDDTPFDLASLTKPMSTAAIAMALVSNGTLDLDTPIRHWFPDAASTGTVRHLLGHAAGCAAHVEFFRTLRVGTHADPYAELITLAARHPASPPGVTTVYSDLGYILLGAILERVAALPLADAFRTLVAAPLGLTASTFPGSTPRPNSVATELDDRGLVCGLVHDENAYFSGGICGHAGLFAPITDVARFAAAIVAAYADTSLPGSASSTPTSRSTSPFRPDVVHHFLSTSAAPATTWRLGWDSPASTPGISHAGELWPRTHSAGHTGFTGTSLWLDLAHGRWLALLTNRVHPSRHDSVDGIKSLRRSLADAVTLLDL